MMLPISRHPEPWQAGPWNRPKRPQTRSLNGFTDVLGRSPTVDEQAIWKESYQRAFHHFSDQPDARDAWLKQGSHGVRDSVDREALSAWATVCLGILNLDETLNRE